jgi:hypothetical protein
MLESVDISIEHFPNYVYSKGFCVFPLVYSFAVFQIFKPVFFFFFFFGGPGVRNQVFGLA